jgi:hypothetical protein
MVQTVAKFVEQGDHFIVGEQRRLTADGTVKVAGQISDRLLQRTVKLAHLADAVIHPCPAAFMFAGVEVEVEAAAQLIFIIIKFEEAHFRMPDINIGTLFRGNAVNTLNHFEQAVNGFVFREVRAAVHR